MAVIWHGVYNFVRATAAARAGGRPIGAVGSTPITVQAGVLIAAEIRASHRERPSILGPCRAAGHAE
jgi:hypothetical protein